MSSLAIETSKIPRLDEILTALHRTAVARDHAGGHAAAEKARIRDAGWLKLGIPRVYGGDGLSWPDLYRLIRQVAVVDSAVAHVLAFHYLQIVTVLIYGNEAQRRRWLEHTARTQTWWGNGMNPRDKRLVATSDGTGGYWLNGDKGFCSGTRGSSQMTFSAAVLLRDVALLGVVPTHSDGIVVHDDWDPIGQRQTDSGSVTFSRVHVPSEDVLRSPDAERTPFQTLRNCFAQLVLVNLYLGIARGAIEESLAFLHQRRRSRPGATDENGLKDPFTLHRFGEMQVRTRAGEALADQAASLLAEAYELGARVTSTERAAVAIAIAEARTVAQRAGLFTSQELFEVTGSSGTASALGLDRFWRNVRTHSLHDGLDHKVRAIGDWLVNAQAPDPDHYG